MGKKKDKKDKKNKKQIALAENPASEPTGEPKPKLKRKEYEELLEPLQVELVKLQEWVKATGAKIIVVFEGRDAAGKGGIIKAIAERTSPRVFRVAALPSPTEKEKSQMYIQRYMAHFPSAGEVVLFDRSWYNRAGVERVMGFTPEDQVKRFLRYVPAVERTMIESGILLVKYWLEVSQENQTLRFEERIERLQEDLEAQPDGSGVASPLVRLHPRAR